MSPGEPRRLCPALTQRVGRGIDTRYRAAQSREFLRKQPAPAAHIENPKALRIVPEILGQDAAHVAEAGRVERALQDVEEAVVLPPRMAEAVVHLVIHWHGTLPRTNADRSNRIRPPPPLASAARPVVVVQALRSLARLAHRRNESADACDQAATM